MYTAHPEAFSGLSGPGHAVVGDGSGGYRTGRDGTMYKGLDPAKPGWLDLGNRATGSAVANGLLPPLRPIWELHLRDTTVCLGGDGNYYMTGSSGDNIWDRVDGVELWRSSDLQHWDYLGVVWSMAKDATWQKTYRWIWAPQIVYFKKLNTYGITLSWGPPHDSSRIVTGILLSTTGKPTGPYVNPMAGDVPAADGIDGALFEDDDGTVYFTNGSGGTVHKMKPDISGFDGDPIHITYSDHSHTGGPAHEGASLFKANGKYYIGGAATVAGRYSSVDAIADTIAGPYRAWQEAVPCGGGGNFFQDKDGNWWCTYFGNDDQSPWREKPGLVKIEFDDQGLIHIAKKQPDFVLIESARNGKSPWSNGGKAASGPPALGWSSWSNTWNAHDKMNEDYIKAQADVMAVKLKSSGYTYINLDDGWSHGFDGHGRLQPDPRKFPNGIAALAAYVHAKGLKLGLYLTPGLRVDAWQGNGTVAGTNISLQSIADPTQTGSTQSKIPGKAYHIDFTKPGAKEYIQSYADLLASWGVDYVKMDFVGPGGGNTKADTREDIRQWQAALKNTGRPIWLELSNKLSIENIDVWKANANGWRIENDVEAYNRSNPSKLTTWAKVSVRFSDAPKWAAFAGPGGWNDLDSLEIGNGNVDGLTPDERQTVMTLWAISCSPLILGSDLTKLDDADLALLTNPEVLAVDQAGSVATPLSQASPQQVWRVKNSDGSFTVALFNLGDAPAQVGVTWTELGFSGPAAVRDLWQHRDLGKFDAGYETTLASHACQLLRVQP
jgi:hypothetical protein